MTTIIRGSATNASTPAISGSDADTGVFFPSADNVAITTGGVERLRIDASGNVGIGASSPGGYGKFVVNSSSSAITILTGTDTGNGFIQYIGATGRLGYVGYGDTSANLFLANEKSANLILATNNTERMRIDAAGNVGIGIPPSSFTGAGSNVQSLQIRGTSFYANGFNNLNIATNVDGGVDGGANGGIYGANDAAARYQQIQGLHIWYNASSGTAGNAITFSERMRIDSSGNVGIGESSPGEALHLKRTSGDPAFRIQSSAGNCYVVNRSGTSAMDFLNAMNGPMLFGTNNTERMRIDSSGNVGVNISNPSSYINYGFNLVVGPNASSAQTGTAGGMTIVSGTSAFGAVYFADGTSGTATYPGIVEYNHFDDSLSLYSNAQANGFYIGPTTGEYLSATSAGGAFKPAFFARAWVNFNGTGTVAIRASGNVSSITDNGAGNYTVNFTTAMPDTNYAVSGSADAVVNQLVMSPFGTTTTTACQVLISDTANPGDNVRVSVVIHR